MIEIEFLKILIGAIEGLLQKGQGIDMIMSQS